MVGIPQKFLMGPSKSSLGSAKHMDILGMTESFIEELLMEEEVVLVVLVRGGGGALMT